jgi:hypothetical protein
MSPRRVWIGYVACLVGVCLALALLTRRALDADRAEAAARHEAAVEENVRLALWRIDSALGILVARETANVGGRRDVVPPVRDAFVIDGAGRCRVVAGAAGEAGRVPFAAEALAARLPGPDAGGGGQAAVDPGQLADLPVQQIRAGNDFKARQTANLQQQVLVQEQTTAPVADAPPLAPLTAVWVGDVLVLARRVAGPAAPVAIEGCVLDWPALRTELSRRPRPIPSSTSVCWPRSPPGSSPETSRTRPRPAGRRCVARSSRPGGRWPSPRRRRPRCWRACWRWPSAGRRSCRASRTSCGRR